MPVKGQRLDCTAECIVQTFMPQVHLYLQRFEVLGRIRLCLSAHLLARPLLEAAELLVDVHGGRMRGESKVVVIVGDVCSECSRGLSSRRVWEGYMLEPASDVVCKIGKRERKLRKLSPVPASG